jgi:hypothetical protein
MGEGWSQSWRPWQRDSQAKGQGTLEGFPLAEIPFAHQCALLDRVSTKDRFVSVALGDR